jgi:hypothetical protein
MHQEHAEKVDRGRTRKQKCETFRKFHNGL